MACIRSPQRLVQCVPAFHSCTACLRYRKTLTALCCYCPHDPATATAAVAATAALCCYRPHDPATAAAAACLRYPKTLTALLLSKSPTGKGLFGGGQGGQYKALEWGWPARSHWLIMTPEERKQHVYLDRFKLALSDLQPAGANSLPPGLKAEQVGRHVTT